MSASIRVESGISAGTNYWIDRPVLRIGSDPQCDICLPTAELAPHALTLEFRDGAYRAYNRGTAPVTIGSEIVKPGATGIWRADQSAQLPGDVRLMLEVDGDPRPSPRSEGRLNDGFDDTASVDAAAAGAVGDTAAKKSSKSLVQMGIIGVCMLLMAGMLMMKRGGSETVAADRPTFESIVQASLKQDDAHRAVVRRLQFAEAAWVRGNTQLARDRFLKLRDQLVHQDETLSVEERADAEKVLSYVQYQLGRLE